jgi:hypothetical protein
VTEQPQVRRCSNLSEDCTASDTFTTLSTVHYFIVGIEDLMVRTKKSNRGITIRNINMVYVLCNSNFIIRPTTNNNSCYSTDICCHAK